ncbi:hypothetical protein PHBOTO_004781 [Pseudozyma hubeiensis]|nr:hypothetical protein PHBOTO_004781 [Pseudozyma hubeiensis]
MPKETETKFSGDEIRSGMSKIRSPGFGISLRPNRPQLQQKFLFKDCTSRPHHILSLSHHLQPSDTSSQRASIAEHRPSRYSLSLSRPDLAHSIPCSPGRGVKAVDATSNPMPIQTE